ncbi:beta-propeller fold lactonase family protein [Actinoplanes sp. CA-142083]|uniref:beta-propeller fold lactonase family protein n=1 Tax=Actinoplanes sp. CA-142083 TaxID=3239903 RepID=UPI003D8DCE2E
MSDLGLPTHVLTEIDSPIREARLTAVDELARIAAGADLGMASAARRALEGLTQDDSRSVSAAAATALERTAIRLRPDRVDFGQIAPGTPRVVADVLVDGPPLATATATVTVSGPGLRAMLAGQQLRILWQPRSEWLDGSVTVRGPAGWGEVRVTGQVLMAAAPMTRTGVEAQMRAVDGLSTYGPPRVTVLPPPRERRSPAGAVALVAGLTALVLLGGVGVAWALVSDREGGGAQNAIAQPPPTSAPALEAATAATGDAPAPATTITREALANRISSVAKPAVIGTIKVGNEPEGIAVSPDSKTVYVANQGEKALSVVDAASRKATSMKLRNTPRFVAVSRDGRLVFASMYENDLSGSGVAVLDAAGEIHHYLDTGKQPYALAVGPTGKLWVPIHSSGRVEIYSSTGGVEEKRINLPRNPHAVGFSSDQQRAFTANHESNAVAVVDTKSDKFLKAIPVSKAPHSLAVSPDGRRVLVAGYEANAANLIDTVTLKETGPFKVGRQPQSVAFAADGEHAYVVNEGDDTISVLNGRTGQLTATVKVGHSPRTVAVSPDGRLAFVSNGADDTISVLRVGE